MDYLRALRPLNLFIVAATQLGIYYKFFFLPYGLDKLRLAPPLIWLFVLVTIIIAACGYLINDYIDYDSDKVNEKAGRIKDKNTIFPYYFSLLLSGFMISLYIAHELDCIGLAGIYLLASVMLFLYATYFKRHGLIGNMIVAAFASGVLLIFLIGEGNLLLENPDSGPTIRSLSLFSAFVFLVNLIREIVKDVEDMEGDMSQGCSSFPIIHGIEKTRFFISGIAAMTMVILLIWIVTLENTLLQIAGAVTLILPLSYLLFKAIKFSSSFDATFHSRLSKFVMIFGLGIILLS